MVMSGQRSLAELLSALPPEPSEDRLLPQIRAALHQADEPLVAYLRDFL